MREKKTAGALVRNKIPGTSNSSHGCFLPFFETTLLSLSLSPTLSLHPRAFASSHFCPESTATYYKRKHAAKRRRLNCLSSTTKVSFEQRCSVCSRATAKRKPASVINLALARFVAHTRSLFLFFSPGIYIRAPAYTRTRTSIGLIVSTNARRKKQRGPSILLFRRNSTASTNNFISFFFFFFFFFEAVRSRSEKLSSREKFPVSFQLSFFPSFFFRIMYDTFQE